jgi:hypothetical protein
MAEKKERKTKRKVDLVSSHSDHDGEDGPLAAYSLEGSAVSELYKNDSIPSALRYLPKAGETVVYEEIFIPEMDRVGPLNTLRSKKGIYIDVKRAMIIIGMMITNVINIQSGEELKNIITRYQYLESIKLLLLSLI